ncbi:MAG: hypothetical protein LBM08_05780 [Dysgonamonadaceae bacterium]|jgi:hypothetical protein|nr:hypothetical protein [Dysgonamonadaceae bacterium]
MKNIVIKMFSICIVALFAFSCQPKCDIKIKNPGDIKPVDWENYNDVYTVFWNYLTTNIPRGAGYPTGETIKVYGKIDAGTIQSSSSSTFHSFALMDEHEYADNDIYGYLHQAYTYPAPSVRVVCYPISDELQEKFASCDLTGKCYIKGELATAILGSAVPDRCRFTVPNVYLRSMDDIYFENDQIDNNE